MTSHTTPVIEACKSLVLLNNIWDDIAAATGGEQDVFIEKIFGKIWEEGPDGDTQKRGMEEENDPEVQSLWIVNAIFVGCSYVVDAMKANLNGNSDQGWKFAVEAAYWTGLAQGAYAVRRDGPSAKQISSLGAEKRHSENRAMKTMVMQWCDENMASHRSMDAAAESIAGKVVPVKFRTAREWIGEWKKLRSNGTP